MSKQISVVVPLLNESESLPELAKWIDKVMHTHNFTYELIMIDDGSTDNSWEIIEELRSGNSNIRGVKFRRNYGKSAALHVGFSAAIGEVVITMDADLQDSPDEIPELRRMIVEDGYDLVSGWKKERFDSFIKNRTSKVYNWAARKMSGIQLNDFNCGLKAYRLGVVKNVEVYGEMHRYIPIMAKIAGFKNIGEKVVQHQARQFGETKFGIARFIRGPLDLLSIHFVGKFSKRPMHFFGGWGLFFLFAGFVILSYLTVDKLFFESYGMTERPLFFFGILTLILGMQMFLAGFVSELVSRNAPNRNNYKIEKELN